MSPLLIVIVPAALILASRPRASSRSGASVRGTLADSEGQQARNSTRNHRSVPQRNRPSAGGGLRGGRPAMRVWRSWPLAPWALPSSTSGTWSDAAPAPLGCRVVTGKRPSQLARGECALYEHHGKQFVCVRDDAGKVRCMSRIVYLQQPAFHA